MDSYAVCIDLNRSSAWYHLDSYLDDIVWRVSCTLSLSRHLKSLSKLRGHDRGPLPSNLVSMAGAFNLLRDLSMC